jgi:mannose-6-phosphate isomerase-like protein (cupin superfamily)
MRYYIGNYKKDAKYNGHRGWLVGTFMEENNPNKVDDVEIKYYEHEIGPTDHGLKVSKTFECTFILEGESVAEVDGQECILTKGQYIVLPPGVPNNLHKMINRPLCSLTIKAPSDPTAKKVIKN